MARNKPIPTAAEPAEATNPAGVEATESELGLRSTVITTVISHSHQLAGQRLGHDPLVILHQMADALDGLYQQALHLASTAPAFEREAFLAIAKRLS